MNKTLAQSEAEFVAIFTSLLGKRVDYVEWDAQGIEEFIGVEFPFVDGTYLSDLEKGDEDFDDVLTIDTSQYRKTDMANFPSTYPCLVLWTNELDYDRIGEVRMQMLEFVYPTDFLSTQKKAA